MSLKQQVSGLNDLLTAIRGAETRLSGLLAEMGFDPVQIERLRVDRLGPLVTAFVDALRQRLEQGWDGERRWRIISRRFGLDGAPPDTLEALAQELELSRERVGQLQDRTLARCRSKAAWQHIRSSLHRIALQLIEDASGRPDPTGIEARLEGLADVREAADKTRAEFEANYVDVMRKIQVELDALEVEYQPLLEAAAARAAQLEAGIRNDVLRHGANISGRRLKAVYSPGRVTWDTKGIARYAGAHPELLRFRRHGESSVSIRTALGRRRQRRAWRWLRGCWVAESSAGGDPRGRGVAAGGRGRAACATFVQLPPPGRAGPDGR